MNDWLMKSEPEVYSISDLKSDKKTSWEGVRNYQARNFMRDQMKVGDRVLFYHSNANPPGIAGVARVIRPAYPDASAWNPKSKYYDPKASPQNPIWVMVDIEFVEEFPKLISLDDMKAIPSLQDMLVLKRGMRLSVQPVSENHFGKILEHSRKI